MQDAELLRYARHVLLPEAGVEAQQCWLDSSALIIGAGGLGCAAGLYLAAAGVGYITVVDHDTIELSNLQRQIAHHDHRIGENKAISLRHQMLALNPSIQVHAIAQRADSAALNEWVPQHDIVLDCTDNFTIRQVINAACVTHHKPLISASALGFSGQLAVFDFAQDNSACYACLYPPSAPPEEISCATSGVIGPLVGVMGSMQANQSLLVLAKIGLPLHSQLLLHDALDCSWNRLSIPRSAHCTVCGHLK
ncbi:molybdopterin-synthase adenylyltransferase MoeB [Curvibacter sp. CHRR-16]|uniref:HesA/MoeB/ThiF family protein n=1 Tax=Curvibacter sp. CHRR-16 TaxID=2835872 RepID=UPI001BDB3DAA|nr:molybdopterin-synthase adenylyltransferase MoeB [Curvibacter sp. CHRR-16]MBT0569654.1 molybdopterin-synthase adenylyltransferase MoeB [Curvibacter sp. CHRR-16]